MRIWHRGKGMDEWRVSWLVIKNANFPWISNRMDVSPSSGFYSSSPKYSPVWPCFDSVTRNQLCAQQRFMMCPGHLRTWWDIVLRGIQKLLGIQGYVNNVQISIWIWNWTNPLRIGSRQNICTDNNLVNNINIRTDLICFLAGVAKK